MRRATVTDPTATPRDVFARIQHLTLHRDFDIADLYAEDGVHEWPFSPPGAPRRLEGRERIRAFFSRLEETPNITFDAFHDVVIHDTTDPEVIVAEYDLTGTVAATKNPFRFSYVLVLRARGGLIVELRDYLNPAAMAEAMAAPPGGGRG
jgi:uncharacterized protein